jgi:hypothetical protein
MFIQEHRITPEEDKGPGPRHGQSPGILHLDMMAVSERLNVSQSELARTLSRSSLDMMPFAPGNRTTPQRMSPALFSELFFIIEFFMRLLVGSPMPLLFNTMPS